MLRGEVRLSRLDPLLVAAIVCAVGARLAYLAFDANQILFAVAGMETQIAVAILLGGVYHLLRGQTLRTGAFLGLAMLVRPEFVLWVLPALAYLVWRDRASGRRDSLRALGMMLAIWAPWLIFTTAYYGSPIPHTIPAKAAGYTTIPSVGAGVGAWWHWAKHMISLDDETWWHLAPFYEN